MRLNGKYAISLFTFVSCNHQNPGAIMDKNMRINPETNVGLPRVYIELREGFQFQNTIGSEDWNVFAINN